MNSKTSRQFLKTQIRLIHNDDIALGPGKIELLESIANTGSISAAGRHLGMSYRRAWLLVETMNNNFQSPLVISSKGGKHGGGAQLTELGQQVLMIYQEMQQLLKQQLSGYEQKLCALLKEDDSPNR